MERCEECRWTSGAFAFIFGIFSNFASTVLIHQQNQNRRQNVYGEQNFFQETGGKSEITTEANSFQHANINLSYLMGHAFVFSRVARGLQSKREQVRTGGLGPPRLHRCRRNSSKYTVSPQRQELPSGPFLQRHSLAFLPHPFTLHVTIADHPYFFIGGFLHNLISESALPPAPVFRNRECAVHP